MAPTTCRDRHKSLPKNFLHGGNTVKAQGRSPGIRSSQKHPGYRPLDYEMSTEANSQLGTAIAPPEKRGLNVGCFAHFGHRHCPRMPHRFCGRRVPKRHTTCGDVHANSSISGQSEPLAQTFRALRCYRRTGFSAFCADFPDFERHEERSVVSS